MTGGTKLAAALRSSRSPLMAVVGLALLCDGGDAADLAYRQVVTERASQIVSALESADDAERQRVVELIANQYVALSEAHERRDARLAEKGSDEQTVRDASYREVDELHRRFVASLAAELSGSDLDRVKDGMTYSVVPITYAGYQRLLPQLTADQKRMILANLIEAREYAMDAGSSDEKHGWFGKYKGRINNRLSQAGHDLKQAEQELAERESR